MTVLADLITKTRAPSKSLGGIIKLVQIALLVLIGYVLVKAIILFFNPEVNWKPLASGNIAPINGVNAQVQSFDFSTDPFGVRPKSNNTIADVQPAYDPNFDVPETTLDIKVKGWIAGEAGSASLQTPDRKEASYQVGETVLDDVTLEAVTSDYIVLNVNGELQRLTFERDKGDMLLGQAEVEGANQNIPSTVSSKDNSPKQINFDTDASDLLQQVRLNPNFDQGKLTGYVIRPKGDEKVLTQFGLQSGDRLIAINGDSLIEGRLDLKELALTLNNAKSARLDIIRNGRSQTVKIGR